MKTEQSFCCWKRRAGTAPQSRGPQNSVEICSLYGGLPDAKYFLIATPERMYGWKQDALSANDIPPQFTVDAEKALGPYFVKLNQDPAKIGPREFELLILTWLTDITRSTERRPEADPSLKSLSESGLLSSLQQAEIEMNAAR